MDTFIIPIFVALTAILFALTLSRLMIITEPMTNQSSSNNGGIPNIVHQTAATVDRTQWDPIWVGCHQSWKNAMPDAKHILWTDTDIRQLVEKDFPELVPFFFHTLQDKIERIDFARYLMLYKYGGIYADMDYQCLRDFRAQLPGDKASVVESNWIGQPVQNSLMASPAQHPFWLHAMLHVMVNYDKNKRHPEGIFMTTGPLALLATCEQHPDLVHRLPMPEYNPLTLTYRGETRLYTEADIRHELGIGPNLDVYTVHYGTCTWC